MERTMNGEIVHHPVSIVGTGPGDPDLLTVRAARIIGNAEVILYDCPTVEPSLCIASPSATVRFIERVRHDGPSGQQGVRECFGLCVNSFTKGSGWFVSEPAILYCLALRRMSALLSAACTFRSRSYRD